MLVGLVIALVIGVAIIIQGNLIIGPWPSVVAQVAIVWLSAALTHRSRHDENPDADLEYALANAVGIFMVGIGFYIGGIGDSVQWQNGWPISFDPTEKAFTGLLDFAGPTSSPDCCRTYCRSERAPQSFLLQLWSSY